MLIIKWLVIAVLLLIVVAVAAGQLGFLQGTAPADLGVRNGKLKPPSMPSTIALIFAIVAGPSPFSGSGAMSAYLRCG